ncbi:hypothetical protein HPB47_008076 [Ixodes persulcatus]|uniref:Uncharacterized protein n=1 Tax=Ixodes persulcatus TaxID=34615 RepID=A0AC60P617_IXOPE|nr:hypothetical protein HPB47_008076 [Ixodes persulcatus]
MSASDVARRIAAFEFASRASDLIFGNVYALPRVPRPSVRDRENPMERYNDGQFLARYRFTKETVRELLAMLPLQASADNRGLPLPPMLQLLVTLRFYGAGTFQIVTGDLVNVSQPTVCRTVGVVTRLIARHLFKELVHFPDASQLNTVMREFFEIARFPGVTGCIDCTHVRINSPGGDDAEVYRNRKGVFSINVQVGSHRIFDNSRLRVMYEEHRLPGHLLGDMGYACFPFLMTPLPQPVKADTPRGRQAHIKTRNSVERAFGVWKRRFPCLDMRLQHKPGRSASIVTACAALHNLACLRREPQPPPPPPPPVRRRVRNRRRARRLVHLPPVDAVEDTLTGIQTREIIIEKSFTY